MHNAIVKMSKHKEGFTSMGDFNGEKGEHVGALLGHYDFMELYQCDRMSEFFFEKREKPEQPVCDENNGGLQLRHEYESQKLLLFSLNSLDSSKAWNDPQTSGTSPDAPGSTIPASGNNSATRPLSLTEEKICALSKETFTSPFFMLTLLETKYEATLAFHDGSSMIQTRLLDMLKSRIEGYLQERYVNDSQTRVFYQTLLSMSQNEIAVMWYTNNVELPARIAAYLRDITVEIEYAGETVKMPLFNGSRTLVAVTRTAYGTAAPIASQDVKLLISLSYKKPDGQDRFNLAEFRNELEEHFKEKIELRERYGSHDLMFELPLGNKAIDLYLERVGKEENPFIKCCRQIHTRVILPGDKYAEDSQKTVTSENVKASSKEHFEAIIALHEASEENRKAEKVDEVEDAYNRLTQRPKETKNDGSEGIQNTFFDRNPFLLDALFRLKADFYRCRQTTSNPVWAKDLEEQFVRMQNAIDIIIDHMPNYRDGNAVQDDEDDEKKIKDINTLIITMQQVHGHVTQGNKLFYEAPGSSLPYSGALRSVIWAYNGILKSILTMIYSTRRDTRQQKVTPILTFGMTPVIKVEKFGTYGDGKDNKETLLVYQLPAAALYNVIPYVKMLLHESHHYSAPSSRYIRNKVLGSEVVCGFFAQVLLSRNSSKVDDDLDATLRDNGIRLFEIMSEALDRSYNEVMPEILYSSDEKTSLDAESSRFFSVLRQSLNGMRDGKAEPGECLSRLLKETRKSCSAPEITRAIDRFLRIDGGDSGEAGNQNRTQDGADETTSDFIGVSVEEDTVEDIVRKSKEVERSIDEACCDLFMIQCTEMDATQYLDFICDYMYTIMKPFNTEYRKDIPRAYGIRLGMIIDYFCHDQISHSSSSDDCKMKQLDSKAEELISAWEEHNKKLNENRIREGRNTYRTQFRLNLAGSLRGLLSEYRSRITSRRLLYSLIEIGRFDVISNKMFEPTFSGLNEGDDLSKENKRFLFSAQIMQKALKEYLGIQKSQNAKEDRERMIMRLVFKLVQYYSGETRSWSDVWEESKQTGFYARNTCIYPEGAFEYRAPRSAKKNIEFHIRSFGEFIPTLNGITDKLQKLSDGKPEILWYRGVEQRGFNLTPSIYRQYDESKPLNGDSGRYQNMLLNEFVARASSSGDIDLAQISSTADWLSVMQHYFAKTHFLDWSEQLFGAMYFMLEPIMRLKYEKENEETKSRAGKSKKNGVALYILAPHKLNEAWRENLKKQECPQCYRKSLHAKANKYSGVIPNLSRKDAEDVFCSHLLGCDECFVCQSEEIKPCPALLPMAIQTNRSNKRISAQAGTFVAFSANAVDRAESYDLLKIQEKWLDDEVCEAPFIYKLVVHEPALQALANWLETVGMRTFRFYPDLEYIGKEVSDSVHKGEKR